MADINGIPYVVDGDAADVPVYSDDLARELDRRFKASAAADTSLSERLDRVSTSANQALYPSFGVVRATGTQRVASGWNVIQLPNGVMGSSSLIQRSGQPTRLYSTRTGVHLGIAELEWESASAEAGGNRGARIMQVRMNSGGGLGGALVIQRRKDLDGGQQGGVYSMRVEWAGLFAMEEGSYIEMLSNQGQGAGLGIPSATLSLSWQAPLGPHPFV